MLSIGHKLAFILFRDMTDTVQGVLRVEPGKVSEHMVRWAERYLKRETIVDVEGAVVSPAEDSNGQHNEVKDASIHTVEIDIHKVSRFPFHFCVTRFDAFLHRSSSFPP